MKDTKYIRKRTRSYGTAFLVEIPYLDDNGSQTRFTQTVRVIDFDGSEKLALRYAQQIRNEALTDIQSGKLRASVPSVKAIYERKWDLLPLSINTREKQDAVFKKALAKYEKRSLRDITVADIQESLNIYAETHSADAVKRLLTIWRQIYRCALMLGYDLPDRTDAVVLPKSKIVTKRRPVEMDPDAFQAILDGLLTYSGRETYNNRGIWFMLQIMYYTGCRPAEALALTADDIAGGFIHISKAVGSTTTEKRQIVPPKTASSERAIPIVPDLSPILDDLIRWSRHRYLLADESGDLRDIDEISNTIHLVARKHNVQFNAYMLRHLMSTELLHKGDSVVARDLLGHTSFSMTLDYARSTPQQLLSAVSDIRAESQPKNRCLEQPPEATKKAYQILRITACMRFIAYLKGLHESGQYPCQTN